MKSTLMQFSNYDYILKSYDQFLSNPESLSKEWRAFFEGFHLAYQNEGIKSEVTAGDIPGDLRISMLIDSYKRFGYKALCGGLGDQLSLKRLGFSENELEEPFVTMRLLEKKTAPLKEIIARLEALFCTSLGFEFFYPENREVEEYIFSRILSQGPLDKGIEGHEKIILELLGKVKLFESSLQTIFPGVTRFSIEGGESFVYLLHLLLEYGANAGVSEVILGMAHRGRLNVLCNVLGKEPAKLMCEFLPNYFPTGGSLKGDVKYHMGFAQEIETILTQTSLSVNLMSNPSHLETVNPVVQGYARKRQEVTGKDIMPIVVHGDSAFAGQGIVYETMQMARVDAYKVGGTCNIVINNGIGYTTLPNEYQSTSFCTNLARAFSVPVFHVKSGHLGALAFVAKLSSEVRQKFGIDVIIDFQCYRKHGHNEGDEPRYTQPLMYKEIKEKKDIYSSIKEQFIAEEKADESEVEAFEKGYKESLNKDLESAKRFVDIESSKLDKMLRVKSMSDLEVLDSTEEIKRSISIEPLKKLMQEMTKVPDGFNIHPKIEKMFSAKQSIEDEKAKVIDFSSAEMLALGSLLSEDIGIRLCGEDVKRGTFSHRHAIIYDQEDPTHQWIPLRNIESKGTVNIYNSTLSELAALGFEYGYSLTSKKQIVIWEAQFGDFINMAQPIIDLYIASSQEKWGKSCALTMLLPHGYEGMGPEHSSCRVERFLQLAVSGNMFVCYPTTPSQFYHMLRAQGHREENRPMVVLTPKKLLRFRESFSSLDELSEDTYKRVIDDERVKGSVKRVLLVTGKIYYDLLEFVREYDVEDVEIVRIEQLYPFDSRAIADMISKYKACKKVFWVQEEPQNHGFWSFIRASMYEMKRDIKDMRDLEVKVIARVGSATTVSGYSGLYAKEREFLMKQALMIGEKE